MEGQRKRNNKKKRKKKRKKGKNIRDYCKDKDNVKTRNEYFISQQGCEYKIRLQRIILQYIIVNNLSSI